MNVIIFSKNRAMQLDALLHSIQINAPQHFMAQPNIIYASSEPIYAAAYEWLRHDYPWCHWLHETVPLKAQVLQCIDPDHRLTTFLVDDDIFYRKVPEFTVDPGTAYCPRLGDNCTFCWNENKPQPHGTLDLIYQMSLDGHVYCTSEIRPLIAGIEFELPGQIEDKVPNRWELKYNTQSCLVGVPHNRVQEAYPNRTMGGSAEELNKMFMAGHRIDIEAMDYSGVNSVHMPLEYRYHDVWDTQPCLSK